MSHTPNTRLVSDTTGETISEGDTVSTFRGDVVIVTGWSAPSGVTRTGRPSTGRVRIQDDQFRYSEREVFPGVINCTIQTTPLTHGTYDPDDDSTKTPDRGYGTEEESPTTSAEGNER
jgi:hypothetical protein